MKIGKKLKFIFITLVLFVCLSSCTRGKLLIMEANYYNSRGRFNDAITSYFKALEYTEAAAYAQYGLGSVFYSLNEEKAALERFGNCGSLLDNLSPAEHRELRYRNIYNSGIIYFSEGDYIGAAEAFKDALRLDPRRLDAKHNLELSLMSLSRQSAGEGNTENQEQDSEARSVLFEYLKQKEQNQWKSREWDIDDNQTGPDY